jgi:hypothetical protein
MLPHRFRGVVFTAMSNAAGMRRRWISASEVAGIPVDCAELSVI